jgi:protein TonB
MIENKTPQKTPTRRPVSHRTGAKVSDNDRFGMTFFLATIFHGLIILGVTFSVSPPADSKSSPALDIILVQTKSPVEVEQADYLAQVSQQGGGDAEEKSRPTELFSAQTLSETSGITEQTTVTQIQKQRQNEELALLTQQEAEQLIDTEDRPANENQDQTLDTTTTNQNSQTARLAAEIDETIEIQASIDKIKYLNSSTREFTPAKYMREWIDRVERIGNLNYPDQARRKKLSGTLILDVVIDADGQLIKTDLRQSSGHQLLDDAARRIVKLSAPFSAFPKKLRKEADVIHITRSWEFLNSSQLRTR